MTRNPFTLVLTPPFEPTLPWPALQAEHAVIALDSLPLLHAALETAQHAGVEVSRIILDQTVTADEFLKFLSSMSTVHRSDVLFIRPAADAFLSAVTRDDGRVMYHLEPRDLSFYLGTLYGHTSLPLAS